MEEEIKKKCAEIITNKEEINLIDIDDNIDINKNNSFETEPNKFNHYNDEYYLIDNKIKNQNILNNTENSIDLNNNSSIKDLDLINNNQNQFSNIEQKNNFLNKNIDYSEFSKNKFETNKNNDENEESVIKVELNDKEFIKINEELIEDNKLLNSALNERTSKLNKIIKENISLKSKINNLELSAKNNEEKIKFYEEQFNIFKNNIENYKRIINELKSQNEKLNKNDNDFGSFQNNLENEFKNQIKEEIIYIKKNLEEINNQNKIKITENNDSKNENNTQNLYNEIKILKEKNEQLNEQNELMKIENKKLLNQNEAYKIKIEEYINQINDLNNSINNKDILINELKEKEVAIKKEENNKNNLKYEEKLEVYKNNEIKLKEKNNELNKKLDECNLKLKDIININENLDEQLKKKQNEIDKLTKEINEKDKLYNLLKNDEITKIKEYEVNIKSYKEQLDEKNKIINNLKNENEEKEKLLLEQNNKEKIKNETIIEEKKQLELKDNKTNIIEKEKYSLENNKEENEKINEIKNNDLEKTNNIENKKEEKEEKVGRRYKYSLRNKFLQKKEEAKKMKELEKQNMTNETNDNSNKKDTNIINDDNNNINNNEEKQKIFNEEKIDDNKEEKTIHGNKLEEEKDEVKESIRKMNRQKNYTYKPKFVNKKIDLSATENSKTLIEHTVIDNKENTNNDNEGNNIYYLYGIDRNDYFHIFDINNKKYEKIQISKLNLDEKSSTFKKDYQYEGTILYNTLKGIYILTGEKTDTLYFFNSRNNTISKICKFNSGHNNGNLLYDEKNDILFVFGGKKVRACEFYNFKDKKIYKMPDLIIDRANASFIISDGKIFGFFGFSYEKNNYSNNIEYIDYKTKEKWIELKNINVLEKDITFDMESVATIYYKNNEEQIMIYNGIKGDDEDFVTDYYLIYNTKTNIMTKIKSWDIKQFKLIGGKKWKNYILKKTDPQGFHFAKNTNFLSLNNNEGNLNSNYLMDYKNNVHFVDINKETIEIYRGNI